MVADGTALPARDLGHQAQNPMKTTSELSQAKHLKAQALLVTLVATGIALGTVSGIVSYSESSARLTARSSQYQRAVMAAEAATEKVVSQLTRDYLNSGEAMVRANLNNYRQVVPSSTESAYWAGWNFTDAQANSGKTFVNLTTENSYVVLDSAYSGLKGFASTYTVVSNARETGAPSDVVGGVLQQVQLARIPIFQFAMYSSGDMEISCGQPFTITGRVHSNAQLYIEPDNLMTFQSNVTAVGDIQFQRSPLDSRTAPVGSVVYEADASSRVAALTLPIGVTNTPTAIREIIEPPSPLEDPNSPMGRQRYYNQTDMVLVITNSGTNFVVTGASGRFNAFSTAIPAADLNSFVSTSSSFWDARESKTVQAIDLNIARLTSWSATNSNVRLALGSRDISSIYVLDARALPASQLGAVRVSQGTLLPSRGLTIATASPLYVWGNYNQYNPTNLGTANTATSLPASFAADAVTILSPSWTDANSAAAVAARLASPVTINAAILAGAVDTAGGVYGGGMENFPRFLETWGLANAFTYNGSMVKLFPSLYATGTWGHSDVYSPPTRAWSYDINFDDPTKLPPLTPGLQKVVRSVWTTVPPNQTSAPSS
jgi:hypothetical protein